MARDFVFTWDGVDYRLGDITLDEAESIEARIGVRWGQLAPIGSARHRLACMAVFLSRALPEDQVAEILKAAKLDETTKMWRLEDDDLPKEYVDGVPLAAGGASTGSS